MFNLDNLKLNEFIAIDVETTGLDLCSDRVIEIAAVKFKNGIISETFSTLLNPGKKIPYFIENLTGISNSDIVNAPIFNDIGKEFVDFIGSFPIVGHNIKFDIDFINMELDGQYNLYSNNYICDTYYLTQIFLYDSQSFKLQSLCNDFKIEINKVHRAKQDSEITGKLFIKLIDVISKYHLNDFNSLYKIYSDDIMINKVLFEECINYYIGNSNEIVKFNKKQQDNIFSIDNKNNLNLANLDLNSIFSKDGLLNRKIEKYQYRKSQLDFSNHIQECIDSESILVAEAETGLGKTFGYLIPSLFNNEKRIVVSTSTHNLQEQIFNKDLPTIAKILDVPVKATILKGMKNYICRSRLQHLIENIDILDNHEKLDLLSVVVWSNYTVTGDISECNGFKLWRNKKIWDLICYDHEFCNLNKSGNHDKCFYQILKSNVENSSIVIINHSLLASCYQKEESIIDDCDVCIIDEAHKLSDNFRMQMKETLNKSIIKGVFDSYSFIFTKLINQNKNHNQFSDVYLNFKKIIEELSHFIDYFDKMSYSFSKIKLSDSKSNNNIQDIRYKCSESNMIDLDPHFDVIHEKYKNIIKLVNKNIKLINNAGFENYTSIDKADLTIVFNKILDIGKIIDRLFTDDSNNVNWITIKFNNGNIRSVSFNSSPLLINDIFKDISSNFNSIVLTSATLTTDDNFDYILKEIGLDNYLINKKVTTEKFYSPFLIEDQIKLFVYQSNEDVNSKEFIVSNYKIIKNLSENLNKRMLVLCTSYKQISDFKNLSDKNMLFQDINSSKQILLDKYLKSKNSVLFGTSSFWEGVDLPEDKLEVLFILKLPFSNPYNPIVQAKIESYIENNLDPFMDYQLSESILKLKQGMGRLIRRENDTGICVISDPRILSKRYGENIIDSFPVDFISYNNYKTILVESEKFLGI